MTTMALADALYLHASRQPTQYMLFGKAVYPDEVYGPEGFMPFLARLTEKRMSRLFDAQKRSGFRFRPDPLAAFGEIVEIDPEAADVHPDSIRLSTMALVATEVLGLGRTGWVDITPLYESVSRMVIDESVEDFSPWPPFKVIEAQ